MSDDDLEQRIRTVLRADAENARISPHAWTRVSARLASSHTDARPRSHRGRSIGLAVAGVAALATVGALVGPQLLRSAEPVAGPEPSIVSESPSPTETFAAAASWRTLGVIDVGTEVNVMLSLRPGRDGAATVRLAAYRLGATADIPPPFAQVDVATIAKPASKIGVCQLRVRTGQAKVVTVSVAPDGKTCGKPVSYTIGDTAFTKTG